MYFKDNKSTLVHIRTIGHTACMLCMRFMHALYLRCLEYACMRRMHAYYMRTGKPYFFMRSQ